jgi:hypothetical protein
MRRPTCYSLPPAREEARPILLLIAGNIRLRQILVDRGIIPASDGVTPVRALN